MARLFSNNYSSTLVSSITDSDLTIEVASASGLPNLVDIDDHFLLTIDDSSNIEIVKVTGVSGTTLTVERAQEGTTAESFSSSTTVELRLTAGTLEDIYASPAGNGSLSLLSQIDIDDDSAVDITSIITSDYDTYIILFKNLVPASSAPLNMRLSQDNGSTFEDDSNYYLWHSRTYTAGSTGANSSSSTGGTAQFSLHQGNLATGRIFNGRIELCNPLDSLRTSYHGRFILNQADNDFRQGHCAGMTRQEHVHNAIRFFMGSGNLTSGQIQIFGLIKE